MKVDEINPLLKSGGIIALDQSPEHAKAMSEMAIEVIRAAMSFDPSELTVYTDPDKDYDPMSVNGVDQYPYLTPGDGWRDDEINGGRGIRFPNDMYPGDINRNTIMHFSDDPNEIIGLPFQLHKLARMAVSTSRHTAMLLRREGIDPDRLSLLTRAILYPAQPSVQNYESDVPVALKDHSDKGAWTVTDLETGPGFEYLNAVGDFVSPATGNYLFAADLSGHTANRHRVNQKLIDGSSVHADLDPVLNQRLSCSPYARLAIIRFYREL